MTTPFLDKLAHWAKVAADLTALKAQEVALRRELFGEAFTAPEEGTNTYPLPAGWKLKGTQVIDRKVDVPAYTALLPKFREAKLPVDDLIKWKPEVSITEYRKLAGDSLHLFDQALIIKPSETPGLEIVPPSKKK